MRMRGGSNKILFLFACLLPAHLHFQPTHQPPVSLVNLAMALGIAFWGDRPGPKLWIGGAMTLVGILLIALRSQAKARPVPVAEEL